MSVSVLAESDWTRQGISLCNTSGDPNQPDLGMFHSSYDVVFVDSSGYHNICSHMLESTFYRVKIYLSHCIRNPTTYTGKNKGTDQLTTDQHRFSYTYRTIPLLIKSKISSFCFVCFLVTPINKFLIILGRCTLYTPVCLQDEPTCMRIEPV